MKKSLFFVAAASALMLTACSSESDVVQNTTQQPQTTVQQQAVGFDIYTPAATNARRAGYEGVMTTDKLKINTPSKVGFGVMAFYIDDTPYPTPTNTNFTPNFMFNEHIYWKSGWTYDPLKYWPNETTQDSQSPNANTNELDKISFFAYAPYVSTGSGNTLGTQTAKYLQKDANVANNIDAWTGSQPYGIMAISRETAEYDPLVEWKATPITTAADLDKQVDLLWGVAPNGMSYQSVNPSVYIDKPFGFPLYDMVKPDKDQKIKFLFQHALSRIGLSVVSSIDQVAPGDDGGVYNKAQTRVLIKSVEVFGDFGTQGVLNLNNDQKNKARWISDGLTTSSVDAGTALYTFDVGNGGIAKDLRYEGVTESGTGVINSTDAATAATRFAALNEGVLSSEKPLLAQGVDPSKLATGEALSYAYGKALYTLDGVDYVRAKTAQGENVDAYTKSGDVYTQVRAKDGSDLVMNGTVEYFKVDLSALTPINVSGGSGLTASTDYYREAGTSPNKTYTKITANGGTSDTDGTYYLASDFETKVSALAGANYSGTCYTDLAPRYFMVIPTGVTAVKVKINYAVVTYDDKLAGYVSDVDNLITKQVSVNLESGKSYNLKLILGLTSVKLDATVADWQVADASEIYLPQNN